MKNGAMSNRYALSNMNGKTLVHMDHTTILNIGSIRNFDCITIATNDRIVPNTDILA